MEPLSDNRRSAEPQPRASPTVPLNRITQPLERLVNHIPQRELPTAAETFDFTRGRKAMQCTCGRRLPIWRKRQHPAPQNVLPCRLIQLNRDCGPAQRG